MYNIKCIILHINSLINYFAVVLWQCFIFINACKSFCLKHKIFLTSPNNLMVLQLTEHKENQTISEDNSCSAIEMLSLFKLTLQLTLVVFIFVITAPPSVPVSYWLCCTHPSRLMSCREKKAWHLQCIYLWGRRSWSHIPEAL